MAVLHLPAMPLTAGAPVRLAVLRAATGLRLPGCRVLLSIAQAPGALATFDARLASAARERAVPVLTGPA